MVIKNVSLERVCGVSSQIPDTGKPEVAFAGKSNVGKSSLINGLMNRKSLARTSSQPGKTQTINYYSINGEMYLVDLPGYGYARASLEEKARWGRMVERYLHQSPTLQGVFLLADIRRDPSDDDRLMLQWIRSQDLFPVVVATKADKVKRSQVKGRLLALRQGLDLDADSVLIPYSSVTKEGREEIWTWIDRLRDQP